MSGQFVLPLFRSFPERRILHLDADLIAVDKPWGLSTHPAEKGRRDDVVTWLTTHFKERGESSYLGIHQRLDKETSGVVLFTRRKEANPSLAAQFEGRQVEKSYVAMVEGRVPDQGKLSHLISDGDGQRRATRPYTDKKRPNEQEAHASLETLGRAGKRALVRLTPETGRTHQLRAQLAAIGAPIVGDPIYGGAPGRRMMLHAERLTITHPSSGQPFTVSAELPAAFNLQVKQEAAPSNKAEFFAELEQAAGRRFGIPLPGETTAFRLLNGESDGWPDTTVDLYDAYAVLSLYREFGAELETAMVEALVELGVSGVYLKRRPKNASRVVSTRQENVAPRLPVAGEAAPEPLEILENKTPFETRLGDGLSTGLFLDQRQNRERVAGLAKGKSVLNLFAYTGGFSVVAAAAGASKTMTVDVSASALEWARRNLERVGADAKKHEIAVSDVFDFLVKERASTRRWDFVVVDPPSFSTTKSSVFSAESEFVRLGALCFGVLKPGGQLLACTNHRGILTVKFRRYLHEAAREAKVTVKQMKALPTPADFPPAPGHESHLKTLLITIA